MYCKIRIQLKSCVAGLYTGYVTETTGLFEASKGITHESLVSVCISLKRYTCLQVLNEGSPDFQPSFNIHMCKHIEQLGCLQKTESVVLPCLMHPLHTSL